MFVGQDKKRSILNSERVSVPKNISLTSYFSKELSSKKINPIDPAVLQNGETQLSFKQLEEESSKLAEAIRTQLGPTKANNDIVIGFCLLPTEKIIQIIFAILKLGATYLPLDTGFTEEKIEKIISSARPILVICDSSNPVLGNFSSVAHLTEIVTCDIIFSMAEKIVMSDFSVTPLYSGIHPNDRPVCIIYTSGNTPSGKSHGIKIEQRSVFNRIIWEWRKYPYKKNESVTCCSSPVVSIESIGEIFAPLLAGIPMVLLHHNLLSRPEIIGETVQEHRLTRFFTNPDHLSNLLSAIENPAIMVDVEQLGSLRYIFSTSKLMQIELGEKFFYHFKVGVELVNCYGTTESLSICTTQRFKNGEDFIRKTESFHVPIGRPIINTSIYILDPEDHSIQTLEQSGEICIAGYGISQLGYVGSAVNTKFITNHYSKSFKGVLFRTGDYGRILKDQKGKQRLYFEGRLDTQTKVHGKIVDTITITNAIKSTEYVTDVAVVVFHPERENQKLIAAVVLQPEKTGQDIRNRLVDVVPTYMIPYIYPVTELPYFPNGKLDKQELFKRFNNDRQEATEEDWTDAQIQPNELEGAKILYKLISESIGVSLRFVIQNHQHSFWELGGNSLNAVSVLQKVQEHNYPITLDDFVLAKNIPEIVFNMVYARENSRLDYVTMMCFSARANYIIEEMNESHKGAVIEILARSYFDKDEMKNYTRAQYNDYKAHLESIWDSILDQKLSLIAKNRTTLHIVGAMLNFDGFNSLPTLRSKLKHTPRSIDYIFELYESCALIAKMKAPSGKAGKIVEAHMLGTSDQLSSGENILLTQLFLNETCARAHTRGFAIFLITTTNLLVRQLCESIMMNYEKILEYPVNQFNVNSEHRVRPFRMASDYFYVHVYAKKLT